MVMSYIICNNSNYLSIKKDNSFQVVTSNNEAYKWKTREKANNTLNSIKSKYKNYHFEIRFVPDVNCDTQAVSCVDALDYEIIDKVKELRSFIEKLEIRRNYLSNLVHKKEKEILDIEHAAEFQKLNVVQGYKIYKVLHDVRLERRKYKDELCQIDMLLGSHFCSEDMKIIEERINNMSNRKYKPRENEELFIIK